MRRGGKKKRACAGNIKGGIRRVEERDEDGEEQGTRRRGKEREEGGSERR